MKILVSGLVNVETNVPVRGFPVNYYPIDYPFFGITSNVAGVGFNVAKALKALGDDVGFYSYVGRDEEGKRILRALREQGIDASNIKEELRSTASSVVLRDPQGRRQIYCDLKDVQEQSLDVSSVEKALRSCDAAALCNIGFNRALIRRAREIGVLTATDVHILSDVEDDYNRDFMENADVLFLSDEGLPQAPEDFLRRLWARYHNAVIVLGMGAKGAMLLDGEKNELTTVPACTVGRVVNTVGAGDALFSSFLHFYMKTKDAAKALERAVVFAGAKIRFSGASEGFCSENEVLRLCGQLNGKAAFPL